MSIWFLLSFAWRLTIESFHDGHPHSRKSKTSTVSPAKPGDYLFYLTAKSEELIIELKADYTVVIVTHNMQLAACCSDDTVDMYLGDLIEFGATEQIFFKPNRQETEDYITGRFG